MGLTCLLLPGVWLGRSRALVSVGSSSRSAVFAMRTYTVIHIAAGYASEGRIQPGRRSSLTHFAGPFLQMFQLPCLEANGAHLLVIAILDRTKKQSKRGKANYKPFREGRIQLGRRSSLIRLQTVLRCPGR